VLRDGPQIPFFIKPITGLVVGKMEGMFFKPNLKTHFGFLEQQLATAPDGGDYLCGKQFTAADILMSFPLMAARGGGIGIDFKEYPKLNAYVERIENMEGWKRSIKVAEEKTGDKFSLF